MMITKRYLKQVLAAKDADLARLFSITPSAIAQWREDEPVPEIRQWQIQVLRPDIFGPFPQAPRPHAADAGVGCEYDSVSPFL